MTFVAGSILIFCLLTMALMTFGTFWTLLYLKPHTKKLTSKSKHKSFGVTILKPMRGIDFEIEENLTSLFEQDYDNKEIIFCLKSDKDPIIPIINKMREKYSNVPSTLVCNEVTPLMNTLNPKVENLLQGYAKVKFDVIWINDSNTRLEKNFLSQQVNQFESDVGMMGSVVRGSDANSLGSWIEAIYLNCSISRSMLIAQAFKRPVIVGKSMFFRKSDFDKFGGLSRLGVYLAEDYMAGEVIKKLGKKILLSRQPIRQPIGAIGIKTFFSRHLRWGRLRKVQSPHWFIAEFLTHPLIALLLVIVFSPFVETIDLAFAPAVFFALILSNDLVQWIKLNSVHTVPLFILFWLPAQFGSLITLIASWMNNSIDWKGEKYILKLGGGIEKA
jgi:ceramide glucosyltransferase